MAALFKKKKESSLAPKRDFTHDMTLLILGCSGSGKTTAWRHLQLIGEDSFPEDKKYFQKVIYGNAINAVNKLVEIAEKHNFQFTDENKEKVERLAQTSAAMGEFKLSRFPLRLVYDFKCVWEDKAAQQAFELTQTNPEYYTPGRLQYYMENIFRILSPDFRPSDLDILSAYEAADTLQSSEIYYHKIKINALCFPPAVCDNKKWEQINEINIPDALIYFINLTIDTLSELLTTKAFKASTHMLVFLNYLDLFTTKAATVDLKCCFSDYTDGLDAQNALAYVNKLLAQKVAGKGKPIQVIPICALEKDAFSPYIDDLIEQALPTLPLACTNPSPIPQTPHTNGTHNGDSKQEVKENKTEKKKKGKRLVSVESGFDSVQGRRKTMEDKHVIMDNFRQTFPSACSSEDDLCSYYGVYDGHGGGDTSKIVEDYLHKSILQDPVFPQGDIEQAVKNGFLATDTHVLTQPSKSGSTAVIAIIVGNQLLVANAGDSECIMCKQVGTGKKIKTEHVVMSYKHVPTDENEKLRISAAGGLVVFGRLFGSLAVSRSFGDRDYKDGGQHFVSAEPHIKQLELTPEDQFLVMACDGLWDKLSYEDVVGTVTRLRKEGKGATEICKVLVQDAITKESMDNITVVLVFFNWKK